MPVPGTLAGGEAGIWLVDLGTCGQALLALNARRRLLPARLLPSMVDPSATADIGSPWGAKDLARIALRALLATEVGCDIARRPFALGPAGKPGLAVPPAHVAPLLHFSLAHIDAAALVALSRTGPVGVDLEMRRPVRINEARRRLLEHAASLLAPDAPLPASPPDDRFLQAWVRLEAVAKATGEGVSGLLGRLGPCGRLAPLPPGSPLAGVPLHTRDIALLTDGLTGQPAFAAIAVAAGQDALDRAVAQRPVWLRPADIEALALD